MAEWIQGLAGRFLVFDGPDGSGKTTQFHRFAEHCRQAGVPPCTVREPGGTSIGEQIRDILLNPANDTMAIQCEMLLYMASRAQLMKEKIAPALARGELVLADRFISSTLAYQGAAGGIDVQEILAVGRVAVGSCWPELTVVFDVDEKTSTHRMHGKKNAKERAAQPTLFSDRMERKEKEFHRLVRQGYLDQARAEPQKYLVIDATGEPDSIFETVLASLRDHFS
jgi:dTMP kinase